MVQPPTRWWLFYVWHPHQLQPVGGRKLGDQGGSCGHLATHGNWGCGRLLKWHVLLMFLLMFVVSYHEMTFCNVFVDVYCRWLWNDPVKGSIPKNQRGQLKCTCDTNHRQQVQTGVTVDPEALQVGDGYGWNVEKAPQFLGVLNQKMGLRRNYTTTKVTIYSVCMYVFFCFFFCVCVCVVCCFFFSFSGLIFQSCIFAGCILIFLCVCQVWSMWNAYLWSL